MHTTLSSGKAFPKIDLARFGGGTMQPGHADGWQLVVVYRGLHCPICKQYFKDLEGVLPEFKENGIEVVGIVADPEEKVRDFVSETGTSVPIGYDMSIEQMQTLGLYISDPRSPKETDRPFSEPAMFLVNPEGVLQMVDVSNAPFLRPELKPLPGRIKFVLDNDYPVRGTHGG